MRGVVDPEERQPAPLRFLANELVLLGEDFIHKTLEKDSVLTEDERVVIALDSLIGVLRKLKYLCSGEDITELRIWLFNHQLFAKTPKYFDYHTIFVDVDLLIKKIKETSGNTASTG